MSEGTQSVDATPLTREAFAGLPPPHITQPTIDKIKKGGIMTVNQLAYTSERKLQELSGLGEDTAKRATELARMIISPGFISGEELHEKQKAALRLTTGSPTLDRLFSGGLETGSILEIAGEFGSGKSQLVYTGAVLTAQRENKNHVLIIDTEGTTKVERLLKITDARGLERSK